MPATSRSAVRTSVVWDALEPLLAGGDLDVVDVGGGTGGFATRVADRLVAGRRVAVVDPSPDALASLDRRAREDGVADRVTGQQGDLSSLLDVVGEASADLVLCHGVLEVVDDPGAALAVLARVLRPGGTLSLLVAQRHAAVVARAVAGHFQAARELLDDPDGGGSGSGTGSGASGGRRGPQHRYTRDEVVALLAPAGFEVRAVHGVRVFADLVPGSLLDLEPGAAQALVDLERAVAERAEYLPLATQLHVLAQR